MDDDRGHVPEQQLEPQPEESDSLDGGTLGCSGSANCVEHDDVQDDPLIDYSAKDSLSEWSDEEEDDDLHPLPAALPAENDVLDLVILDVDDDDLDGDSDVLDSQLEIVQAGSTYPASAMMASAAPELEHAELEAADSGRLRESTDRGPEKATVGSSDTTWGSRDCFSGLGKRLEPFARLAEPVDPANLSRIRGRIRALEHFRVENTPVQQEQDASPLVANSTLFCRICRDSLPPLIAPCNCRGSVARVHMRCLERWLTESDTSSCELCGHQYTTIRTPSYNMLLSVPTWMVTNGSSDLLFDLVSFAIFTPVALFGTQLGLLADDGDYFQITLTAALDLVYSAWLTMRFHYHAIRWYSWWRRKSTVKLY